MYWNTVEHKSPLLAPSKPFRLAVLGQNITAFYIISTNQICRSQLDLTHVLFFLKTTWVRCSMNSKYGLCWRTVELSRGIPTRLKWSLNDITKTKPLLLQLKYESTCVQTHLLKACGSLEIWSHGHFSSKFGLRCLWFLMGYESIPGQPGGYRRV